MRPSRDRWGELMGSTSGRGRRLKLYESSPPLVLISRPPFFPPQRGKSRPKRKPSRMMPLDMDNEAYLLMRQEARERWVSQLRPSSLGSGASF